jgi:hypothetical protein
MLARSPMLVLFALASAPWAQGIRGPDSTLWVEDAKLLAADAESMQQFGSGVSVSGDTVLVGAPGGLHSTPPGSAYVFVRGDTGWIQEAKLTVTDAGIDHALGEAVSLSGDTALVGADGDDPAGIRSGSAYIFVREGTIWSEEAKLTASDGAPYDGFGCSTSLSGDTALIGAWNKSGIHPRMGAAYVFVRNGTVWSQQAGLTAPDAAGNDYFGSAVSLSGNTAVISSPDNDGAAGEAGAVYVFTRTGAVWTPQAKLTAGDAEWGDLFGWAVSLSGDTVLISAAFEDSLGDGAGAAYVFHRTGTTWSQQAKLLAGDGAPLFGFGWSASLRGDRALIGSWVDDDAGYRSGSAFVFERLGTGWTQTAKLTATDAVTDERFGVSVALGESRAVVGANLDDDGGASSGSAYVISGLPGATEEWYCGAATNLDTYTISRGFVLGGTFQGTVDITPSDVAAMIVGYLGGVTFPIWGQEGLVDIGTPEVMGLMGIGSSPITLTMSMPADPVFAGYHVYTQAAGFGYGSVNLTCAYNCTVGY